MCGFILLTVSAPGTCGCFSEVWVIFKVRAAFFFFSPLPACNRVWMLIRAQSRAGEMVRAPAALGDGGGVQEKQQLRVKPAKSKDNAAISSFSGAYLVAGDRHGA